MTLAPRRDTREKKLDWKQTETRFDSALPTAWSISKKIRSIHPIHDNDEAALDTVAGGDRCMDRLWVRAGPLGDRQPWDAKQLPGTTVEVSMHKDERLAIGSAHHLTHSDISLPLFYHLRVTPNACLRHIAVDFANGGGMQLTRSIATRLAFTIPSAGNAAVARQ